MPGPAAARTPDPGCPASSGRFNGLSPDDSRMGSMTCLVTEDTSSDTTTFEDEAFPLGTEQASESFSRGNSRGGCLEMTHGTGLELTAPSRRGALSARRALPR